MERGLKFTANQKYWQNNNDKSTSSLDIYLNKIYIKRRLCFLLCKHSGSDFDPQPHTQLPIEKIKHYRKINKNIKIPYN